MSKESATLEKKRYTYLIQKASGRQRPKLENMSKIQSTSKILNPKDKRGKNTGKSNKKN